MNFANSIEQSVVMSASSANPFWGAPRIHGELLKLGVDISQATVGSYLPRRPKTSSPTWRSFLHNHLADTAAIDIFIVATATVYLIVLDHDWRKIIHFEVIENPTQVWLAHQTTEAFLGTPHLWYLLRDREPVPLRRVRKTGL